MAEKHPGYFHRFIFLPFQLEIGSSEIRKAVLPMHIRTSESHFELSLLWVNTHTCTHTHQVSDTPRQPPAMWGDALVRLEKECKEAQECVRIKVCIFQDRIICQSLSFIFPWWCSWRVCAPQRGSRSCFCVFDITGGALTVQKLYRSLSVSCSVIAKPTDWFFKSAHVGVFLTPCSDLSQSCRIEEEGGVWVLYSDLPAPDLFTNPLEMVCRQEVYERRIHWAAPPALNEFMNNRCCGKTTQLAVPHSLQCKRQSNVS